MQLRFMDTALVDPCCSHFMAYRLCYSGSGILIHISLLKSSCWLNIYIYMYVYIYIYMYNIYIYNMCIYLYIYIYICIYIYTYTYVYIYIQLYTYVYIYIQIHILILIWDLWVSAQRHLLKWWLFRHLLLSSPHLRQSKKCIPIPNTKHNLYVWFPVPLFFRFDVPVFFSDGWRAMFSFVLVWCLFSSWSGCFLSHGGTPSYHPAIERWDFPVHKTHPAMGVPPWLWKPPTTPPSDAHIEPPVAFDSSQFLSPGRPRRPKWKSDLHTILFTKENRF